MKHAYGKMEGHYSTFKKKVEVLLTEQKMSQVERKKVTNNIRNQISRISAKRSPILRNWYH